MGNTSIVEAFGDDEAARRLLEPALEDGAVPSNSILPLRHWVQAIYLTDAGRLKVSADDLAALLGVPQDVARETLRQLAGMDRAAMDAVMLAGAVVN